MNIFKVRNTIFWRSKNEFKWLFKSVCQYFDYPFIVYRGMLCVSREMCEHTYTILFHLKTDNEIKILHWAKQYCTAQSLQYGGSINVPIVLISFSLYRTFCPEIILYPFRCITYAQTCAKYTNRRTEGEGWLYES